MRLLTLFFLTLAACMPLTTAHTWFMQPGMAQKCTYRTWSPGTGQPAGTLNNLAIGISDDGQVLSVASFTASQRIYVSTNGGATWTARGPSATYNTTTVSGDGTKVLGAISSGNIQVSVDAGTTFTSRDSSRVWLGTAMSDDGVKMVASVLGGTLYTSTNSGTNWTSRNSSRNWYGVASSADGVKLVAVVNGGQIYTSSDSGVNWTARDSTRDWRGASMSADGTTILAAVDNDYMYLSTDSGATFSPITGLGIAAWRGSGVSADGNNMVASTSGSNGRVYRSTDGGATWWQFGTIGPTSIGPATISGDGSTIAYATQAGNVNVATCSYTNKSDGSATDDVATTNVSCGGIKAYGYCWYYGANAESCDTVCATHGNCDLTGIRDVAGSSGTDSQCLAIAENTVPSFSGSSPAAASLAYGCHMGTPSASVLKRGTTTTTCASAAVNVRRLCSCTQ